MKDDIVALLPDLRAFARFMCREREAADDLVQNTILAALDKQAQFTPGTNLKGWLFTIMRNRFYSDLRTQRRRPLTIDNEAATPLPAVDNPEATMALKELSSALWKLNPQSREALVLIGAGGFSYEEAAQPLRLLGRHAEGARLPGAQASFGQAASSDSLEIFQHSQRLSRCSTNHVTISPLRHSLWTGSNFVGESGL